MTEKEKQTEEKIVEAAREVFVEKGMAGARMQEIADRAGINKSLLHYYFRSKEKLFNAIFSIIVGKVLGVLGKIVSEDLSIEEKVSAFVNTYMDVLMRNPFMPNFIFNELTRNPDGLLERVNASNVDLQTIFEPLEKQLKAEGYSIPVKDFVINSLSMVIFPIAAKPMVERVMFNGDKKACKNYLQERKNTLVQFIMNALSGYKK